MRIAVIGATGLVGSVLLSIMEERNFPVSKLILVASKKSVGKKIFFKSEEHLVVSMESAINLKPQITLFSAGSETSLMWAPKFASIGSVVIDNSSAWRMDPSKKLIVPEINANSLTKKDKIISSPNCSTIQLVMALNPLHTKYGIKRLVVSTYQSITGTGVKAIKQLENEINEVEGEMAYPHKIHKNAIPQCDDFLSNGYTKEEMKLVNETKKILNDYSISITSTAVRIPVLGGHSESVNIEFNENYELSELIKLLSNTKGVKVSDDIKKNHYPMPLSSVGLDDVFVGRIRRDESRINSLNMWIVSDNLRKGAALNTVQIAEHLIENTIK
ncbi:MAG: aspartate-semialdehyde dehydrogenase [Flavobacteriaceae bacterium]|nr:aspartate-semialdehyde dehydrogenase [Flavobacteriaceae bacterium]